VRLLAAVLAAALSGCAAVTYGDLPPDAISYSEIGDVAAEICGDYLLDLSLVTSRLPARYRLMGASEVAVQDSVVATLVAQHPEHAARAVGTLCFVSAKVWTVDGVPVYPSGNVRMAFWWARVTGPSDENMRGPVEWLQLASWYSNDITEKSRILAYDPMAQFTDVEVSSVAPMVWRLRLRLPTETISAEVRTSGPRIKRDAPEPGFVSLPLSGDSAAYFSVFTYYGHHRRNAEGQWHAEGSGTFSDGVRLSAKDSVFGSLFQDGWQTRAGLYRFTKDGATRRRIRAKVAARPLP
jgi:hypothetical protein